MSQILYADGREEEVQPANGSSFSLAEMQNIVGGLIEIVRLSDKVGTEEMILVINEEGKLQADPMLNAKATQLFLIDRAWPDTIVGDVLFCPSSQVK